MRALGMLCAVALMSILSTGCATIMTGGGHSQQVRFKSEPRGATVTVDGNRIGQTPVVADLTRGDDHVVKYEMDGYEPQSTILKHGPNLWTFGNLLFGGLIGVAVDAVSGSWEGVLNPNDIELKLAKAKPVDPYALPAAPAYDSYRPTPYYNTYNSSPPQRTGTGK